MVITGRWESRGGLELECKYFDKEADNLMRCLSFLLEIIDGLPLNLIVSPGFT